MGGAIKGRLLACIGRLPQATWYSVDRALGRDEGSRPDNVLEAILELVELGLVNELPGETPAMPVYKLTAEGQGRL